MRTRCSSALAALVGLVLAAGCGGGATGGPATGPPPAPGPAVSYVLSDDPVSVTPLGASSPSELTVERSVFAGLFDSDPAGGGVVPVRARSWQASDDLKTFTFRLRKDVTFTDGEPVTADTFVRDWAIVCATGAPAAPLLRLIEGAERCGLDPDVTSLSGVRALAPDRLEVTLSAPFADLPAVFSNPGTFAFPPDLTDTPEERAAFEQTPVGCGSFRIESWVHGSSISLVRTTGAVKVAGVDMTILTGSVGARAAVRGFRSGRFDATPLPASQLKVTMSDPQLSRRLVIRPLEALTALLVSPQVVPNLAERQAIAHANDPVGAAAASGGGTPADGLIPVTTPGYVPGATIYGYDPAAASSELGGSSEKVRVYADDPELTVVAGQVVNALRAVGLPAAVTERAAGALRVVRLSAAYPSADAIVGPLALGGEARKLLEQSRTTRDTPKRQELQRATAVEELRSAIVIPLTFSGAPFVVQPGVDGAVFDAAGLPHFNQWGWVQSSR